ncbi:peptidylprolyl isomerase [Helicobacter sp. 12S02634-8]|uniref:FKBP-type peptidyl-prolyl cis-trans isomerase n=1 Tax=Helicobacter sp. 12S02634-8 TaxID=1476199 RepID=UPI000BA5CD56|nr:peptidylprolyl isomerase [Helicobacter sp. 12S02634-8]PAF48442.1 peptidylprolyl isomerase [Helicobacter sp. 12S02634-8]
MNSIETNKVVAIEYEVMDFDTKEVVDSNIGSKPLEFLVGAGQVITGLEKAIIGAEVGKKIEVCVSPEEAYGLYRNDFLQEVPKEQFEGITLQKGMTLFGQGEDGQTVQVVVKDFSDKVVMIDYNHPLAGKTLMFNITVLDSREPTEQEIISGSMAGGGCGCGSGSGHHHHHEHENEGGCCGGGGGGCGCSH